MQELIKALIKAKSEFNPIQKSGTNPHYKRKYARANASKLLLITTNVKNQRKNQHFSFSLVSKTQCDR